jgi:folate-dependent phosphoribosylglycinamide formyltransferase PurN
MKRRVAILISGRGSNMAALIEAATAEDFPAEIAVVISNRADAGGLEKARARSVPTVPSKASRSARIGRRSRRFCNRRWTSTGST